jgi:hypothetical protein
MGIGMVMMIGEDDDDDGGGHDGCQVRLML